MEKELSLLGHNIIEGDQELMEFLDLLNERYYAVFRIDLETEAATPMRYNHFLGNEPDNIGAEYVDNLNDLKEYLSYGMRPDEALKLEEVLIVDNLKLELWDGGQFIRTYKWYDMSGERYFDMKVAGIGEAPYEQAVIGIVDVTDSKSIEVENRKNSRIVEALSDDYSAVFYIDAKTETVRLYRADEGVLQRFGDVLNKNIKYSDMVQIYITNNALIKEEDDAYRYVECNTLIDDVKNKGIITFNYTRLFKGERRQYRLKAVKVEEDGEFKGIVLGFRDVEEEYRKDIETQELLRAALEEAKHASSSKSNFLFNMSHDIRTPMNAILGFVALAQNETDNPDKLLDYLDKIEKSGQHLLGLINDVLDMARIESGRIDLHEAPFDLEEQFNETVDMFGIDMDKKGLKFKSNLNITDKIVDADSLRTKQIMLNLLGNALKYTKKGGTVTFKIKQKTSNKNGFAIYQISVKDTGIGMSKDFQKHLFDLFERENRSAVTGVQGTGLGLAITKRLVELMNGEITCNSSLGKGTEFKCTIRLKVVDADYVEEEEEKIDLSLLEGKKVLLVEDNDLNREIARTILEEVGMVVEEATDGTVAVDMLGKKERSDYDVVLMDIQMPYMDGYKATRIIRNAEVRTKGHVPIIAMTANAFEEDKAKAFEAGMDAHIAKPVDTKELYRELVRLS